MRFLLVIEGKTVYDKEKTIKRVSEDIMKRKFALFLAFALALITLLSGCDGVVVSYDSHDGTAFESIVVESFPEIYEDGEYYEKDEVAAYIYMYGHLPSNYITKSEAQDLGWNSRKGNLWDVAYGKCIGGDYFGNYERKLPKVSGRKYYECDVNYYGGYRSDERLIYCKDGYIYYTEDHYNSFEMLYGGYN